jgi:hypothetical protein
MTDKAPETLEDALAIIASLKTNNAALLAEKKAETDKAASATEQAGTLEQRLAQLEGKVGTLTTERDAARAESYNARVRDKVDPIFEGVNISATARPDVMNRFNADVELNESGGFVSRATGEVVDPSTWVEGLRESAPHFWPASQGGGAAGAGGGAGGHGGVKRIAKSEMRALAGDADRYAKVKADAKEAGQTIEVVDG